MNLSVAAASLEETPDQLPVMCDNHLLGTPQWPPFSPRLIWLLCPLTTLPCQQSKELFVRLHWKLHSFLASVWPKMWHKIHFSANYPTSRILFWLKLCAYAHVQNALACLFLFARCVILTLTRDNKIPRCIIQSVCSESSSVLANTEQTQFHNFHIIFPFITSGTQKMLWAWVDRSFALGVRVHSSNIPISFATSLIKVTMSQAFLVLHPYTWMYSFTYICHTLVLSLPFNDMPLYESLLQPWYNPLCLTEIKAPTN